MNYQTIKRHQREQGYDQWQFLIDSGNAWVMEGAVGREAMHLLEIGACMLPKRQHRDYYGNRIPPRDDLKQGSKGTYHNCVRYYTENEW
jgi:hypothetical protein